MAQILEGFERDIEPCLGPEASGAIQSFKGLLRARMNSLATDAEDFLTTTTVRNGVALEQRDALSPTGRL